MAEGKPTMAEQTQPAPPAADTPATPETGIAELTAQIQQLEKTMARQLAAAD